LQFIAAHEPTLLQFAEASGRDPASVTKALSALPFGDSGFDRSI
jgi:predicted transcriptional regulator